MQALESLLREEFRSDPYVGTGAEEVLAVVGAAHRRSQRRSAVAGAVVVLLTTTGALSLPGTGRLPSTPVRPPVIAGIDSANADAIVNDLEKAGMNPRRPVDDRRRRRVRTILRLPDRDPGPAVRAGCCGDRDKTAAGQFRALKTPSLDLDYMYMFDARSSGAGRVRPELAGVGVSGMPCDDPENGDRTWRYIGRTMAGYGTRRSAADRQLIAVRGCRKGERCRRCSTRMGGPAD